MTNSFNLNLTSKNKRPPFAGLLEHFTWTFVLHNLLCTAVMEKIEKLLTVKLGWKKKKEISFF